MLLLLVMLVTQTVFDHNSVFPSRQVVVPPFYTRLNCAKLLIEVEEYEVCVR